MKPIRRECSWATGSIFTHSLGSKKPLNGPSLEKALARYLATLRSVNRLKCASIRPARLALGYRRQQREGEQAMCRPQQPSVNLKERADGDDRRVAQQRYDRPSNEQQRSLNGLCGCNGPRGPSSRRSPRWRRFKSPYSCPRDTSANF
jgi:hypothetical protein